MGSIDRTKSGRWKVRYRDPSGRQRAKTFERKADARTYLRSVEGELVQGVWRDPALEKIKYVDWAEEWFSTTVNLRPSTRKRDETYLNKHVLPRFGSFELGAITPREVRSWVADLVEAGLAPATVRKAYQILSKSLKEAVDAGILASSPCRGISLPRVEVKDWPVVSAAEVLHLAEAIGPRYTTLVLLAAYTGMRWGELAGLRVDRVDLEKRTVEVVENVVELDGEILPPSPPKTKAGRRKIPLPPSIAEKVRVHIEALGLRDGDLLFQAPNGGALRKSFRSRFWIPATRKAGVHPLRFHDLRHTAVSYWILCGASPKQIAKWAGHSSVSVVLDRYGHLFPESDERPIAALDEMFRQAESKIESLASDSVEQKQGRTED